MLSYVYSGVFFPSTDSFLLPPLSGCKCFLIILDSGYSPPEIHSSQLYTPALAGFARTLMSFPSCEHPPLPSRQRIKNSGMPLSPGAGISAYHKHLLGGRRI